MSAESEISAATGAEGTTAVIVLDSVEDSADQGEGLEIVMVKDETVASGEEGHHQEDRVVSEEDLEEGEILMVMVAGSEMIDPAADAKTTALRLRGTPPIRTSKTNKQTKKQLKRSETIHKQRLAPCPVLIPFSISYSLV